MFVQYIEDGTQIFLYFTCMMQRHIYKMYIINLLPYTKVDEKNLKWIIKNDVWSYSIIVPDDGYSRNASCAVNFISTFLFQYRTIHTFVFKRKCAGTCIRGVINMDLFSYTKVKVHELMDTQKLNYQINYHGKNLFNRVLHHTL